jgi:hypothetical protein
MYVEEQTPKPRLSGDVVATYKALIANPTVSEDSIHELISRFGLDMLGRDVPYLVAVAKGLDKSKGRTEYRRRAILEQNTASDMSVADPLRSVLGRDSLRRTLEAMIDLSDLDAAMLWWHALGHSDSEIADLSFEFDPGGSRPSESAVRKRRSRLRKALRSRLSN